MEPAEPDGACTTFVAIPAEGVRTRYFEGLPPELTGGVDTRREMPPAALVLLVPYGDGRWDVARYAADGAYAGDSHHDTWAHVVEQLRSEYVSDLAFTRVPDDAADDARGYASVRAAQPRDR